MQNAINIAKNCRAGSKNFRAPGWRCRNDRDILGQDRGGKVKAWIFQDTALGPEKSGQDQPRLCDIPEPVPGDGECLVEVHAAALNFADLLMAKGQYQDQPKAPYVPGMEFAGVVLADNGAGVAPGSRVAGFLPHGALAQRITVAKHRLIPIADRMSYAQAAAFPVAYGTSHLALDHKARLRPGETLLVLGAAGGVGLTAVEIGKLMGARVIACARGAEKLQIARNAGADEVIDSDHPDLKAALKALGGVDVTYDAVGGPAFRAAMSASRPDGRLLAIGFASGEVPQIPANHLLVKNLAVIGIYWGGYMAFAPHVLTDSLKTLMGWFAAGRITPHVSHELPIADLPRGLDLLRDRRSTGKVVIRVRDGD
jgi:NADPH2:quinone reductase